MPKTLLVTIDTEEEFDWHAPLSPENRAVTHAASLPRLQDLFDEAGARPTYVVDHPFATTDLSRDIMAEFFARGTVEIGTHVHPWVNPPIEEKINPRHSYMCNLPLSLQQEKVARLTEAIEKSLGLKPTTFKAGRYGIDFALIPFLASLGYTVDTSIIAYMDFREDEGPDFSGFSNAPFWLEPPLVPGEANGQQMLEVPCTVGFSRRPFSYWSRLHRRLSQPGMRRFRGVGILWHTGLLRKVPMTPEGTTQRDLLTMLKVLGQDDDAVINLSLHSPSIEPGHTPYVRSREELEEFLDRLDAALRFAIDELGCRPMTFREFALSLKKTNI